jgi:hypothetical protein
MVDLSIGTALDCPSDRIEQSLVIHWLAEIRSGAGALSTFAVLRRVMSGNKYDRKISACSDEQAGQVQSARSGKLNVTDDARILVRQFCSDEILHGRKSPRLHSRRTDEARVRRADRRLVVENVDLDRCV